MVILLIIWLEDTVHVLKTPCTCRLMSV